jgi:transcriptional regulator GlxA family with amidase domain
MDTPPHARIRLPLPTGCSAPADQVGLALDSGFCTAGNLRKHFSRIMQTSPQAYRRTFAHRNS